VRFDLLAQKLVFVAQVLEQFGGGIGLSVWPHAWPHGLCIFWPHAGRAVNFAADYGRTAFKLWPHAPCIFGRMAARFIWPHGRTVNAPHAPAAFAAFNLARQCPGFTAPPHGALAHLQ
jgi:hypothetical protein